MRSLVIFIGSMFLLPVMGCSVKHTANPVATDESGQKEKGKITRLQLLNLKDLPKFFVTYLKNSIIFSVIFFLFSFITVYSSAAELANDSTAPIIHSFVVTDSDTASTTITNNRTVSIAWDASDNSGIITRWLITESAAIPSSGQMDSGGDVCPETYTIQSALDGSKTFYAWGQDATGNISTAAEKTINLDTTTQLLIDPVEPCTAQNTITITGYKESGATVSLLLRNDSVTVNYPSETSWQANLTGLQVGINIIDVTAADNAGNQDYQYIEIRHSVPVSAIFEIDSGAMVAGDNIIFDIPVAIKDSLGKSVCDNTPISMSTDLGVFSPANYYTGNGQVVAKLMGQTILGTAQVDVQFDGTILETDFVEMVAGPPSKMVVITPSQTIEPNMESSFAQVQFQDEYGHPAQLNAPAELKLSAFSNGSYDFYLCESNLTCAWQNPGEAILSLEAGSHSLYFKYRDTALGYFGIKVTELSGNGLEDATQNIKIENGLCSALLVNAPSGIVPYPSDITVKDVYNRPIQGCKWKINDGEWQTADEYESDLIRFDRASRTEGFTTLYVLANCVGGGSMEGIWQPEDSPTIASWTIDSSPPVISSFTINNNTAVTDSRSVTLNLSAYDQYSNLSQMSFSNDYSSNWSSYEPFNTTKNWNLASGGAGLRTVYVTVIDSAGRAATPIFAQINYNPDFIVPNGPENLFVDQMLTDRIKLGWDAGNDTNLNYIVLRSETENGGFYQVSSGSANSFGLVDGKLYFTDENIQKEATYYYKIQAQLNDIPSKGFSNIVAAEVPVLENYEVEVVDADNLIYVGETAKYYIQILPKKNFRGSISLTCTDLANGLHHEFLKNGIGKGTTITDIIPPALVSLHVSGDDTITPGEYNFTLQIRNVWQNAGSSDSDQQLQLKAISFFDKVIHLDLEKTKINKGEKTRILGSILPPKAKRSILVVPTNKAADSAQRNNLLTSEVGKFEDEKWIAGLDAGTYEIGASWIDDFSAAHHSPTKTLTVAKGQVFLSCVGENGKVPEPHKEVTIKGSVNPAIPYAQVILQVIDPDGNITDHKTYTSATGEYLLKRSFFNRNGFWKVKSFWLGNEQYIGTESPDLIIPVGVDLGRAIILGGGLADQDSSSWAVTKNLTGNVYRDFMHRGFSDEMIKFLINTNSIDINNDGVPDNVVDDNLPAASRFMDAIRQGFSAELSENIPLFIYMQGHATDDRRFKVLGDDEYISGSEISDALDELQGLGAYSAQGGVSCRIIIVIESSFSGNFIQDLSGPNRIILTSAGNEQYSIEEAGQISFSRYLFHQLRAGYDLKKSFDSGLSFMVDAGYPEPQLDDNGNGVVDNNDGMLASGTYLYGLVKGGEPPKIHSVNHVRLLADASQSPITMGVAPGDGTIEKVWLQIITPNADPTNEIGAINYPEIELIYNPTSEKYEGQLLDLERPGIYRIVSNVSDNDSQDAIPKISYLAVVNKEFPGDITGDEKLSLADAVVALQVLTDKNTSTVITGTTADANKDGRLGMEELIYILRALAGIEVEVVNR